MEEFKFSAAQATLQAFLEGRASPGQGRAALALLAFRTAPLADKVALCLEERLSPPALHGLFLKLAEPGGDGEALEAEEARAMLHRLGLVDPQARLNRRNIWMVKPASKSRGRGIRALDDLTSVLEYVLGADEQWVAQKYI